MMKLLLVTFLGIVFLLGGCMHHHRPPRHEEPRYEHHPDRHDDYRPPVHSPRYDHR